MAYGQYSRTPRVTRTRKSYPKRTRTSTYKKVVKPARQAIPALQRQVTRLSKQIKPLTQNKLYYGRSFNVNPGTATGDGFYAVNFSKCADWQRIFGTDADDEQSHMFKQEKAKVKWQLVINGEAALVNYTFALVSLTKIGSAELFNPSTGDLGTLSNGVHYTRVPGFNGMGVFLNKRYFNIHYYRCTNTYSSTGYPGEGKPVRMGSINIPPRQFLNPLADWKAKGYNPAPTSNMYLIVFNNDSTVDADVALLCNFMTSGTAV